MSPSELSALIATVLFGLFAIFILLKEQRQKQIIWDEEQKKEQELVSKDEFTHVIVHELRAPTTAIKDAALLLRSSFESLDVKEKTTLLDMIADQSQKMLNQIGSLLDAAKIQAGKFTLEKTESDIAKIIDQQISVFEPVATSKNITLTSSVAPEIPKMKIDAVRIGQVINNLISNSLKFTPDEGTIRVVGKKQDGMAVISVSDTGTGIPKEKQDALFVKFQQVEPVGKIQGQKNHGTGLGLYIVKGIVAAHGGTVKLESEEGKGTTITIALPLSEPLSSILPRRK